MLELLFTKIVQGNLLSLFLSYLMLKLYEKGLSRFFRGMNIQFPILSKDIPPICTLQYSALM